jgi:glycosyltransferase involved in cell wall biosynthesis
LLHSAAAVTTPSRYLYEAMQPYRADVRLLPNPLDVSAYTFRLRERPHPRLVWLRALQDVYNPVMALRVVALLKREYPDVELLLVGPDKGAGVRVRAAIAEMELGERVRLVGRVPKADVPQWLDAGDVFLNTSYVDNTPISLMEAMASGLPIISTDVGGIPYLVRDGENGLLVAADDAGAMAAAVQRVLHEAGLAARLSRAARTAAEAFDWAAVLPQWESLLLEAQR